VAGNEKFKAIRDEIARVQKQVDNSSISLDIDDMRKKQEEARLAKEKVGKQFGLFGDEGQDDSETDEDEEDLQPSGAAWLEEVQEDPYIQEAELIIADMT
jgi:hypothetical protein